jgi:hypothetical protein
LLSSYAEVAFGDFLSAPSPGAGEPFFFPRFESPSFSFSFVEFEVSWFC